MLPPYDDPVATASLADLMLGAVFALEPEFLTTISIEIELEYLSRSRRCPNQSQRQSKNDEPRHVCHLGF
jgi:hypothetical protein